MLTYRENNQQHMLSRVNMKWSHCSVCHTGHSRSVNVLVSLTPSLVQLRIFFPPNLQIVRTDLKELRDLDLEGAPYGYTPFCESRTEMDGYRFWKSGYWASHLGPRKYHIRLGGGASWRHR